MAVSAIPTNLADCSPVEIPGSSDAAIPAPTALVVLPVPAASHSSMNTNALEWTRESLITKAPGPHDAEASTHTHRELPAPIPPGTPPGPASGKTPSIAASKTAETDPTTPLLITTLTSHSHVGPSLPPPLSAATPTTYCKSK